MRFFSSLIFSLLLLSACHTHSPVAAEPPPVSVEVIATIEGVAVQSLVISLLTATSSHTDEELSSYTFSMHGSTYSGTETHDDYFVKGQKYLALVNDSLHPALGSKLLFSNPVFETQELIVLRAGRVLG